MATTVRAMDAVAKARAKLTNPPSAADLLSYAPGAINAAPGKTALPLHSARPPVMAPARRAHDSSATARRPSA